MNLEKKSEYNFTKNKKKNSRIPKKCRDPGIFSDPEISGFSKFPLRSSIYNK